MTDEKKTQGQEQGPVEPPKEGAKTATQVAAEKRTRKTRKDKGQKREKVYIVTVKDAGPSTIAAGGPPPVQEKRLTVIGTGKTAQEAWNNAAGSVEAGQQAECWQRVGTPKLAQLTFGTLA